MWSETKKQNFKARAAQNFVFLGFDFEHCLLFIAPNSFMERDNFS